ncbi:MAG: hypothetical protein AAF543_01650 [Pseudomonadota bacterium]
MLNDSVKASTSGVSPDGCSAAASSWLQARDVLVAGLLALLWLIAMFLPEERWFACARWLARKRLARCAKLSGEEIETVKVVVGSGKNKASWIEESFRKDWLAHKYLSWIQLLASYRPWRFRVPTMLIGHQHLDQALARGNGVILLTANFVYKDLMTKAALAEAGYQTSHLVRDSHGFAESKLGRRLLNPIYARVERRYLHERLVFRSRETTEVNALIRKRLSENKTILVTVTPLGRRIASLPFLHGRIRIATGALKFACEADATVLPVFTIKKADGRIATIIEHPLAKPAKASHGDMIDAMLDDYVPRLETYVAQYPEQFAFPTSDRHGLTLIEPLGGVATSSTRTAVA